MKTLKHLLPLLLSMLILGACKDNVPKIENLPKDKIAFNYEVEGNYALDYFVGSTIKFSNLSEAKGKATWDFGDGSPKVSGNNPNHIYEVAGTYLVTLDIAGEGQLIQKLYISDIIPVVSLEPIEGKLAEIKKTPINLSVFVPNPKKLPITYEWIFPDGTLDVNKSPISNSSNETPGTLYFNNVGSQRVVLKTTLGGRALQEGVIDIQVGYDRPVKTLYYAVKDGNLMALKIMPNKPMDVKIFPFNLGVKSGQHPFNIFFNDSLLYVLDAGKKFTYINDIDGNLGDGRIFVVAKDGSKVESLASNVGGHAFNDPYFGYIDEASKILYFSDRNRGISKIDLAQRNQIIKRNYWVENTSLGYYNNGYQYGAMNANFIKVENTWWWSKTFNGNGVFRFTDADIGNTTSKPSSGIAIEGAFIKSFVVDQVRDKVYFAIRSAKSGFYAATMQQFNDIESLNDVAPYLIQQMESDDEGSTGEFVDICQMVLDPEDGSVYFGYRKHPTSNLVSGLKRYNPVTKKIETLVKNTEIYGVAINHKKTKLF